MFENFSPRRYYEPSFHFLVGTFGIVFATRRAALFKQFLKTGAEGDFHITDLLIRHTGWSFARLGFVAEIGYAVGELIETANGN